MARYSDDSKQRVRDAIDFVSLVSARTDLRRSSPGRYMGRCPFHEERTPSFSVNADEKLYKCFGCGVAGDVFTFAMETEGLDFVAALEWLAERAGVELERVDEDPDAARRRERRERLLELLERTCAYYERVLWDSAGAVRARAYLASRGLGEDVLRRYRVGYAPKPWDRVLTASRRAGYSLDELLATGIATRGRAGRELDRFRERIMFPLADARGRVRGFGARAMRDEQGAKYLNSADGEVFHKGSQLYAADLARRAAGKHGTVILAEGYTDVIALAQAGFEHAVGLMGTSLTGEQVTGLARLAPTVLLCLDADSAGQDAMLRAAQVAAGRQLTLKVVPLPPGDDPADLLARDDGIERMRGLLDAAVPFARFRVERELDRGDLRTSEGRDAALDAVRPVIAGAGVGSLLRDELIRLVADRLALEQGIIRSLLASAGRDGGAGAVASGVDAAAGAAGLAEAGTAAVAAPGLRPAGGAGARRALDVRERAERSFLALCVALPDAGERELAALDLDATFSSALTRRAAAHLREHLRHPADALPGDDSELAALVAELVNRPGEADADALRMESLQLSLLRLDRAIATARAAGAGDLMELARERQHVRERIRQMGLGTGGAGGEFGPPTPR